ncbi:MAG: hypothetical protein KIT22_07835 [Verrucomicrobiae bacterium]|nr:hypothetical protein [Verrucomicrobiae bacterium]
MTSPRIVFCNCTYAQVLPPEVKEGVLRRLCQSGVAFDAVPDLCELSARRDSLLKDVASGGPVRIAACFPRAVKWLFASADAPLPLGTTEVLNLRVLSVDEATAGLARETLQPNLPAGKVTAADRPVASAATA